MIERLQKYMARCGVASRRSCENIIKDGRVSINGEIVREMGTKINSKVDVIEVDNRIIEPTSRLIYVVLNKPSGYITSVSDPHGRPTVLDLMGDIKERIYPIGRLDFESEGLLILTNDGDLTNYLTHPKYEIEKTYYVMVSGYPSDDSILKLSSGINIGDYITRPAKVKSIEKKEGKAYLNITIHEGKNRQVRRMFEAIGHEVIYLRREKIGNISLGTLPLGQWRYLSKEEILGIKGGGLSDAAF